MKDRRFEIGAAQISFLGPSTLLKVCSWTTEAFGEYAKDMGYDGYEWHPTRNMVSSREMNRGKKNQSLEILSAHQSFRSERTLYDVVRAVKETPERGALLLASFLFLPYRPDSLNHIERLQDAVNKKLPVVLYPPKDPNEDSGVQRGFGHNLFQPTQEVMDIWEVKTIEELIKAYPHKGYDGFCFDTTHSAVLGGIDLRDNASALRLVLEHTQEVHIRPGALDMQFKYNQKDPLADLRQFIGGNKDLWFPQYLANIAENWKGGFVITEVQASAINALHKEGSGKDMTIDQLMDYHRQIIENLDKYFTRTEI